MSCVKKDLYQWPFPANVVYGDVTSLILAFNEITVLPNNDIRNNFPNLKFLDIWRNGFASNAVQCSKGPAIVLTDCGRLFVGLPDSLMDSKAFSWRNFSETTHGRIGCPPVECPFQKEKNRGNSSNSSYCN